MLTVFAAQASLLVQNALLVDELRRENDALQADASSEPVRRASSAPAPRMREVYRRIEKVAAHRHLAC